MYKTIEKIYNNKGNMHVNVTVHVGKDIYTLYVDTCQFKDVECLDDMWERYNFGVRGWKEAIKEHKFIYATETDRNGNKQELLINTKNIDKVYFGVYETKN